MRHRPTSLWLTHVLIIGSICETGTLVSAFVCSDGCVVGNDYVNDGECDCVECEDESEWDCVSCSQGCPVVCGLFKNCEGDSYFGLSFDMCTTERECEEQRFVCVDLAATNDICTITCSGKDSCIEATFVIANTGGLQLNCEGYGSCSWSNIVWVNSDNLDTYQSVHADAAIGGPLHRIDCGQTGADKWACYQMVVAGDTQQLGLDTVTQLNCIHDNACENAIVKYRGSLFVDCVGVDSCLNLDLTCLSGANCETVASNANAATDATMTCDSGVQTCVCSEFFDCLQLTPEPMTSTAEAITTTADPSTTETETTTTEALATSTTLDASSTTSQESTATAEASSITTTTEPLTSTQKPTSEEQSTGQPTHGTSTREATIETSETIGDLETTTKPTDDTDSGKDSFDWSAALAMVAMAVVALAVCVLTTCICVYCFWLKNADALQKAVNESEMEYSLDADGSIHLLDEETPEPLDTTSIFLKSTDGNEESGESKIKAAPPKKDFENETADDSSLVAETSKAQCGEGMDAPSGGHPTVGRLVFSEMPATARRMDAGPLELGTVQPDQCQLERVYSDSLGLELIRQQPEGGRTAQSGATDVSPMDATAADRMLDLFVARMGHFPADASALVAFSRTEGASLSEALAKQVFGYRALAEGSTETKARVAADGLSEIVSRLKLSAHSEAQKRNARLLQAAVESHRAEMQFEFEELSAKQLDSDLLLELLLDKADTLARVDHVAEASEEKQTPGPPPRR